MTTGNITTGAGNDLERATDLARRMVCEWGMSDAMGPLTFGKKEEQIFLGREIAQHQDYSEDTALKIDHEVKRFVTEQLRARHGAARRAQAAAGRRSPTRCWRARCSTPSRSGGWPTACRSTRSPAAAPPPADRTTTCARGARRSGRRSSAAAQAAAAGIADLGRRSESRLDDRPPTVTSCVCTHPPPPSFRIAAPRPSAARARRAHARHGRAQRHARLVLRRRPAARPRRAPSTRRCAMEAAGADIIDIGGESTRPGAAPVSAAEELARRPARCCAPSAAGVRGADVDRHLQGARSPNFALDEGVAIVNDISGLRLRPASWRPLAGRRAARRSC